MLIDSGGYTAPRPKAAKAKRKPFRSRPAEDAMGSFAHPGDAGFQTEYSDAGRIASLMHAVAGNIGATAARSTHHHSSSSGGGRGNPAPASAPAPVNTPAPAPAAPVGPTDAQLLSQATKMVSSQLDPQLLGIAGQERQTKTRYGASDKAMQSLYTGLANNLNARAGEAGANYQGAINNSNKTYGDLQNTLRTDHSDAVKSTLAELKRLGIGSMGAEATAGMTKDAALLQNLAKNERATSGSALDQLKTSAVQYMKDMSAGATGEKALRHSDLASQLTQYMQGFSAQKAGINAQRPGAIQDTLQKLKAAAIAQVQAQQQLDMQRAQFDLKVQDTQHDNNLGDASLQERGSNNSATQETNRAKILASAVAAKARATAKATAPGTAPNNGVDAALYAMRQQYGIDSSTSQNLYNIMNRTLTGSQDISTGNNQWRKGGKHYEGHQINYKSNEEKASRVLEDFDQSQYKGNNKYRDALHKAVLAYYGSGW